MGALCSKADDNADINPQAGRASGKEQKVGKEASNQIIASDMEGGEIQIGSSTNVAQKEPDENRRVSLEDCAEGGAAKQEQPA